jgi:hypothetical protein
MARQSDVARGTGIGAATSIFRAGVVVTGILTSEQPGWSTGRHTRSVTHSPASIAAGISLFELARFMGTSVSQIDATYGHLLPDARERARSALDAFVGSEQEAAER